MSLITMGKYSSRPSLKMPAARQSDLFHPKVEAGHLVAVAHKEEAVGQRG